MLDLVEMEVRELLLEVQVPGRRRAGRFEVAALPGAARRRRSGRRVDRRADRRRSTAQIPEPVRDIDKPFLMAIEDVFSIKGRGTVATGRIERGMVKVERRSARSSASTRREDDGHGRRDVPQAARRGPGGRQRRRVSSAASRRKTSSAARSWRSPGSVKPHKKFEGEVYVLKKEEGGRHTPFFTNYRPQFYIRTTDVTGTVTAARGREDGDAGRQHHDRRSSSSRRSALEEQMRFAIREGGKTVGAGVVTKILE